MSQSSFSFAVSSTEARFTNALLVRDVDGQYRAASADEVLSQAWGVLADRVVNTGLLFPNFAGVNFPTQ